MCSTASATPARRRSSVTVGAWTSSSGTPWSGPSGLEEIHEDDALRAVRAALEIKQGAASSTPLARERGVEIGLKVAVEAGRGSRRGRTQGRLAAGDVYNVASRLQGLAGKGRSCWASRCSFCRARRARRAHGATRAAGKARAGQAWRLLDLPAEEALPDGPSTPFVGREDELAEDARRVQASRVRAHAAGADRGRPGRDRIAPVGDARRAGPDGHRRIGRCAPPTAWV